MFEVCYNTANFIPELRALQKSLDHMLSRIGCFGDTTDVEGLNWVKMILIHGQICYHFLLKSTRFYKKLRSHYFDVSFWLLITKHNELRKITTQHIWSLSFLSSSPSHCPSISFCLPLTHSAFPLVSSARSTSQEAGGWAHKLHSDPGHLEAPPPGETARPNTRLPSHLLSAWKWRTARPA